MAMHTGSRHQRFVEQHSQAIKTVLVNVLAYVKSLLEPSEPGGMGGSNCAAAGVGAVGDVAAGHLAAGDGAAGGLGRGTMQMQTSNRYEIDMKEGFPVMPNVIDHKHLKKTDLEVLMRTYLNTHYGKGTTSTICQFMILISTQYWLPPARNHTFHLAA
jgi:hypothetical protein